VSPARASQEDPLAGARRALGNPPARGRAHDRAWCHSRGRALGTHGCEVMSSSRKSLALVRARRLRRTAL